MCIYVIYDSWTYTFAAKHMLSHVVVKSSPLHHGCFGFFHDLGEAASCMFSLGEVPKIPENPRKSQKTLWKKSINLLTLIIKNILRSASSPEKCQGRTVNLPGTRWCPPVISLFINPINYRIIDISTINHSYWSYKPT